MLGNPVRLIRRVVNDAGRRILSALKRGTTAPGAGWLILTAAAAVAGLAAAPMVLAKPDARNVINADASVVIPGRYIVVFKEASSAKAVRTGPRAPAAAKLSRTAQARVEQLGGKVLYSYEAALTGFAAELPAAALKEIQATPGVAWVEADLKMKLETVQQSPPKGLDRTSERLLNLDQRYTYALTGAGVHAYVIDSGIRATHVDFGGRVTGGYAAIPGGTADCYGHGTHVAGTIGGATYGIAKQVALHPVRIFDCNGSTSLAALLDGVNWVTANAAHPAVVNMSLGGPVTPALDTAVVNTIASGLTVVVAAGNSNANACNYSPAHVPQAITVGATVPETDTRAIFSNFGTCLDLFAPGVTILSAGHLSDTANIVNQGTSMAAPHVAGVAALFLQTNPTATPAAVWAGLHFANNVPTTLGWGGVINRGAGSPNELLHWGSGPGNNGYSDGDPHLTTVDGLRYDFQGAGEFVYLRDPQPQGMEIQVRTAPVATTHVPGPDAYHGLATCVSVNTGVALRAGQHRVTFLPNLSGQPDPAGLQLRINGVLTPLPANGTIPLGADGLLRRSGPNGLEVVFADESSLVATPTWWPGQNIWYMNVGVFRTLATSGIIGARAAGGWLPALPDGTSVGPMPAPLPQRYATLYQTFGNAWRVSSATSLFDYQPGTSTATFTVPDWPRLGGQCLIANSKTPPAKPVAPAVAEKACAAIEDRRVRRDCVFDVTVTGEVGFAESHLQSQRLRMERIKPARAAGSPKS